MCVVALRSAVSATHSLPVVRQQFPLLTEEAGADHLADLVVHRRAGRLHHEERIHEGVVDGPWRPGVLASPGSAPRSRVHFPLSPFTKWAVTSCTRSANAPRSVPSMVANAGWNAR